jgi:molybdopterin converting factor small subunit
MSGSAEAAGKGQTVKVLFFASAREAAGTRSASFASDGSTLAELTADLVAAYGDLEPLLSTCAIWVNGAPARSTRVLRAGDEIAVLPPVSGG